MKKVAVTGLGVLCPLGDELEKVWTAMLEGRVGTDTLQFLDPAPYRVKIGGEIRQRGRIEAFEREYPGRYELASVFSILASKEALSLAGLASADLESLRVGCFLGTTMGEVQLAEKLSEMKARERLGEMDPASFHRVQGSRIAFSVLDFLGLGGPAMVFSNA